MKISKVLTYLAKLISQKAVPSGPLPTWENISLHSFFPTYTQIDSYISYSFNF